jgi:hypothetical protein
MPPDSEVGHRMQRSKKFNYKQLPVTNIDLRNQTSESRDQEFKKCLAPTKVAGSTNKTSRNIKILKQKNSVRTFDKESLQSTGIIDLVKIAHKKNPRIQPIQRSSRGVISTKISIPHY